MSISGGNVAYGLSQLPTNGPFPQSILVDENLATITYDQEFTYNDNEICGFYICCLEFDECTAAANNWELLPKEAVIAIGQNPGGSIILDLDMATKCAYNEIRNLAYLWEDKPVLEYLGAPIYAVDEYKLPGAPWNHVIQ